jgi:hypothetical protein
MVRIAIRIDVDLAFLEGFEQRCLLEEIGDADFVVVVEADL